MDDKNFQSTVSRLEKELREIKTVQKFRGNIDCFVYEAFNTTRKFRIYYDNPSTFPITTMMATDFEYGGTLGEYNPSTRSQLVLLEYPHNEVVITSTQPILRVENIA